MLILITATGKYMTLDKDGSLFHLSDNLSESIKVVHDNNQTPIFTWENGL